MLVVIAVDHLNLYAREQYDAIPTVGWMFLALVISSFLLAILLALYPLRLVALASGLMCLGALGAYIYAVESVLFGFHEPGISYSGGIAIASEVIGATTLLAWSVWGSTAEHSGLLGRYLGAGRTGRGGSPDAPGASPYTPAATSAVSDHGQSHAATSQDKASRLTITPLAVIVLAACLLAACGSSSSASSSASSPYALSTRKTKVGTIVTTGSGLSVFMFTRDQRGVRSNCPHGACTALWPPVLTKKPLSESRFGPGIQRSLVGEVRRPSGSEELTYNGWPLYHYATDTAPGDLAGQNLDQFDGIWHVMRPSGAIVKTAVPAV